MMQSTFPHPVHVAIIMDGNGRWAARRGWPRARGHAAGAETVRRVVRAASRLGLRALTLYAFSSDNWRRSPAEVAGLLHLLAAYLRREREPLAQAGVRCTVLGRRDRLPSALLAAIADMEAATRDGLGLHLRLSVDYSGREEVARAAAHAASRWTSGLAPRPELVRRLIEDALEADCGPVDLLIRAGGEKRLSDFLLWEAAYAELWFTRVPWPAFGARELRRALAAFTARERKFGAETGAPAAEAAAVRA